MNADQTEEGTQIKQMNADQTEEGTQIMQMNADHADERRSNRGGSVDQTCQDERRSCRSTQIKQGRERMRERTRCRVCLGGGAAAADNAAHFASWHRQGKVAGSYVLSTDGDRLQRGQQTSASGRLLQQVQHAQAQWTTQTFKNSGCNMRKHNGQHNGQRALQKLEPSPESVLLKRLMVQFFLNRNISL